MDASDRTAHSAVLYIRSVAPTGINDVQQRAIERLERLVAEGTLESVDYEVWGHSVPTDSSELPIKRRYDEFADWADEHGYTLSPAFHVRETKTIVSDSTWTVVSFPLLCLGIYSDRDVEAVFPCSDDDRTYTLQDGLHALESRESLEREDERDRTPVPIGGR
ncbi:HTH domain-containing protein [Natronorarus salvus]|uniref:HTH domain-containing protein n=1 Tax=Natronorarus salvus TaxID=3117733 RepID=UPI002F2657EC